MPINQKIMDNLKREYGDKHGEEVYYAMENEGKIKSGITKGKLAAAWRAVKAGKEGEGELMQYMQKAKDLDYENRKHPPLSAGNLHNPKFNEAYQRENEGKAGVAQMPTDYTKQVDGANDFRKARALLSSMWRKAKESPEFDKERKEHPIFSDEQIKQIVVDHEKSAKFSKEISHGTMPEMLARHGKDSMKEYAEVEAAFMKPGDWHTNGIPYHYDWNTIRQAKDSFKNREFFVGHNEQSGMEYGIIKDVEEKQIDGEQWLVGKIRIPETGFTKSALERIETGLTRYVSCMHSFRTDANNNVVRMTGKAIATVLEPEVDGARILQITRHIKAA